MRWRHKKRGTSYAEVGRGSLQASDLSLLRDGAVMVVYRDEAGELHCRVESEFEDGRFELLPEAPWLVSIPIWGREYVDVFVRAAAPALRAALSRLRAPVKIVVHTTPADEEAIRAALPKSCEVQMLKIADESKYVSLQEAHAEALNMAPVGSRVVLLNADLVVSGNLFERCAAHFATGKCAVVLLGIRTTASQDANPPAGAAPRKLLAWAWEHRHQIIKDLEWPSGGSMIPTNLFFMSSDSVVARGFHLHPVAVVKYSDEVTCTSTIDGDLLDHFQYDKIHVVVDPDDCAMLEVSTPDRRFPVRESGGMTPQRVAASMATRASATHRWLFGHRIGVLGPVRDCGDGPVAREVLDILNMGVPAVVGSRRGRDPRGLRGSQPTRGPIPGSPADYIP